MWGVCDIRYMTCLSSEPNIAKIIAGSLESVN